VGVPHFVKECKKNITGYKFYNAAALVRGEVTQAWTHVHSSGRLTDTLLKSYHPLGRRVSGCWYYRECNDGGGDRSLSEHGVLESVRRTNPEFAAVSPVGGLTAALQTPRGGEQQDVYRFAALRLYWLHGRYRP